MSTQEIWKHPRANLLETLGCKFVRNGNGQKCSKNWIEKPSGYSLKSNPCKNSNKYNHKLGKVGFKFFLNKLRLVLKVRNFTWLHRYNRIVQNINTKLEPKRITWGISTQFIPTFIHFISNSFKFCLWGRGVALGENT